MNDVVYWDRMYLCVWLLFFKLIDIFMFLIKFF